MSDSRKRQVKRIVNAAMKTPRSRPRDPEHGRDRVGHPRRDVLRALCTFSAAPGVAEKRELVRLLQIVDDRRQVLEEVPHRSDDPHEEEQPEQRDRDRGAEHGDGRREPA